MVEILCKNPFLLIELNALKGSISKSASDNRSSFISCIVGTIDSHPACSALTCNEPAAVVISSRMCDTTKYLLFEAKSRQFQLVEVQDSCPMVLIYMQKLSLPSSIQWLQNPFACYCVNSNKFSLWLLRYFALQYGTWFFRNEKFWRCQNI